MSRTTTCWSEGRQAKERKGREVDAERDIHSGSVYQSLSRLVGWGQGGRKGSPTPIKGHQYPAALPARTCPWDRRDWSSRTPLCLCAPARERVRELWLRRKKEKEELRLAALPLRLPATPPPRRRRTAAPITSQRASGMDHVEMKHETTEATD